MSGLGKLERIDNLRSIWPSEEADFTPFVSTEAGLDLLAQTIGFGSDGLELIGREVPLPGSGYHADILCRETGAADDALVLIENQFGTSDHNHLGKLLTYAGGLKARTVILIGESIRLEHRAALDWLNSLCVEGYRFFAVEIELWRIGDSAPAPRFNVVVEPNDWAREAQRDARQAAGEPSELKQAYARYWEALRERLARSGSTLRVGAIGPKSWYDFRIGKTGCQLRVELSGQKQRIQVGLYLNGPDAKLRFQALAVNKEAISNQSSGELVWDDLPNRDSSRIAVEMRPANPTDESDWERQQAWIEASLRNLDRVFRARVAGLSGESDSL